MKNVDNKLDSCKESTWQLADTRYERHDFGSDIRKQLSALKADNITGTAYVIKDYVVILLAVWITLNVSWWAYPFAVLIIGAHQRGLTTVAHDAAHGTLAKTHGWNQFLGIVFAAYPLFQRHWAYRVSHVSLHHPHLGDPDKDPDLQFFLGSGVYDVCEPREYFRKMVLLPLFGLSTVKYIKFLFGTRFKISKIESDKGGGTKEYLIDTLGFFAFWALLVSVSIATGWFSELLLFWLVPYLTASQILGWFVEIAEHSPMCETENTNIHLTRNRKGNWIERILLGVNLDEYHLEHHLSPGIPFYHLRKAQKIRLQDPEYLKLSQSWAGVFCKGPSGQPGVLEELMARNKKLYEAQRQHEPLPSV